MKELLIIANASTFKTKPRGIQVNRLLDGLSRHYSLSLLTSTESVPDSKNYFDFPLSCMHVLPDQRPIFYYLIKQIFTFFPSLRIHWNRNVHVVGKELLKKRKYNAILALSYKNMLAGMYLNRISSNCSLIVYLADPIYLNPYFNRHWYEKHILKYFERKVVRAANRIVLPSVRMLEAFHAEYPEHVHKFKWAPHIYNADLSETRGNHSSQKVKDGKVIRYIGSVNHLRSPKLLIDYLVQNKDYFKTNNITFEFIGRVSNLNSVVRKAEKSGVVSFRGEVPFSEVTSLISTSDALLLIDANFKESLFLPSKLIEYLPYGIPIIGITPDNSESARVLKETGHWHLSEESLEDLKSIISNLNTFHLSPSYKSYSQKSVIKKWKEIIDDL